MNRDIIINNFPIYNLEQNESFPKKEKPRNRNGKELPEYDAKDIYGPEITDEDSALLDKHDSFYMTTKSLLVLFQNMGVMPIMRVPKVGRERLTNFQDNSNKRFDEVIYNIIFLSILIPHFLLPIASWRHGPEVAIFKNMWTHYQDDFELWHSFAYYHIIAMLDGFCSLWYINCNAFGTASKGLATNLHTALKAEHPALKLAQYRHLWVDLSHMMQQLGRAYSNMYGIYCMVIFFTTIISLYGSLSEILEHGLSYKEMGLFVIVGYCMTLLFIICNEAYHASRKVGLEFQVRLLNVNLGAIDRSAQREVEMFLVAIAKNPPIMNLDGFTNINRENICGFSSIADVHGHS
ncbi:Gustatory and odorant receptor 22 [Papilio xuthus]|uniref:Gustatory receptor n=1 Tax=Papilio xuthus TaxID=66420 RepID=A0A194PL61_PAPXU|nr:Gustatory and odorant receptor 22 [Papilio xuthus]